MIISSYIFNYKIRAKIKYKKMKNNCGKRKQLLSRPSFNSGTVGYGPPHFRCSTVKHYLSS